MFKSIKNKIAGLVHGIQAVFSKNNTPQNSDDCRKKSGKNNRRDHKKSRSGKHNETQDTYIRAADRRPQGPSGNKKEKRREPVPVPRSERKRREAAPELKKEIPPMPELVCPPEAEGRSRFFDFDLAPEILAGTQSLGFEYCTEVQAKALPVVLAGSDLAAKAQTGTGKTAAFLTALMTRLIRKPLENRKPGSCRVLVLAPTRELAIQIEKDAAALGKYTGLNNLVIFGGMDHKGQREALLNPVDILVGTPGRIIDYTRSGHLDLSRVETLVIDEADRMLDMGFIPDVRRIVSHLPAAGKRQTTLFSATLEPSILRLVDSWLRNPVSIESQPEHMVTELIEQKFYAVTSDDKLAMLLNVIKMENPERMMVFGNRKDHNKNLVQKLYAYGVDAELLSGDVAQEKRLKILERFRSGAVRILVATDVAARGIHVDGVTHVVNYDLPVQPDDYVHRIGRTGRAGATGISISFVCEYGAYMLPDLEQYTKEEIHTVQPPEEMLAMPEKIRHDASEDDKKKRRGGHGGSDAPRRYSRSGSGYRGRR